MCVTLFHDQVCLCPICVTLCAVLPKLLLTSYFHCKNQVSCFIISLLFLLPVVQYALHLKKTFISFIAWMFLILLSCLILYHIIILGHSSVITVHVCFWCKVLCVIRLLHVHGRACVIFSFSFVVKVFFWLRWIVVMPKIIPRILPLFGAWSYTSVTGT